MTSLLELGYEEIKVVGRGHFGRVQLVRHREDKQLYVCKTVDLTCRPRRERESARQEVELLRRLDHPNIVAYRDSFFVGEAIVIAMQYCEGGDLSAYIREKAKRRTRFREAHVNSYLVQILLAMKYIHGERILHRDLKSSNLFLTDRIEGGWKTIKLGDFGISRILEGSMEVAMSTVGTPHYMSPEVCENRPYTFKSDVWSLGCVIYEVCTLKHAFTAANLLGLVSKIVREKFEPIPAMYSVSLSNLIQRMLTKNEAARPSIRSLLDDPHVQNCLNAGVTSSCSTPAGSMSGPFFGSDGSCTGSRSAREKGSLSEDGESAANCSGIESRLNERLWISPPMPVAEEAEEEIAEEREAACEARAEVVPDVDEEVEVVSEYSCGAIAAGEKCLAAERLPFSGLGTRAGRGCWEENDAVPSIRRIEEAVGKGARVPSESATSVDEYEDDFCSDDEDGSEPGDDEAAREAARVAACRIAAIAAEATLSSLDAAAQSTGIAKPSGADFLAGEETAVASVPNDAASKGHSAVGSSHGRETRRSASTGSLLPRLPAPIDAEPSEAAGLGRGAGMEHGRAPSSSSRKRYTGFVQEEGIVCPGFAAGCWPNTPLSPSAVPSCAPSAVATSDAASPTTTSAAAAMRTALPAVTSHGQFGATAVHSRPMSRMAAAVVRHVGTSRASKATGCSRVAAATARPGSAMWKTGPIRRGTRRSPLSSPTRGQECFARTGSAGCLLPAVESRSSMAYRQASRRTVLMTSASASSLLLRHVG